MNPDTPSPPDPDLLAYQDADGVNRPRTLISLLGQPSATHEAAILAVAQQVAAAGRRPVICASDLARDFIVNGTLAVELLPRRVDLPALGPAEYAAYLKRRWDTVLAKWQITEEIRLGQSLESFLDTETALCHPQR